MAWFQVLGRDCSKRLRISSSSKMSRYLIAPLNLYSIKKYLDVFLIKQKLFFFFFFSFLTSIQVLILFKELINFIKKKLNFFQKSFILIAKIYFIFNTNFIILILFF